MALADGSLVGPYLIVRKIGQGGMGEVYEALHTAIERRVAIKILHAEFAREAEISDRFLNEARIANRVSHPGLVQVFDYSQHADGRYFIVMEYLAGENLTTRIARRGGCLTAQEAVPLFRQISSAMAAAHEKGIIHRDLKPDNVMIVPDGERPDHERVKLLDFGLAKLIDRPGTKSGVLMGTPHYMSPEQCRGANTVTDKTDVYSLGVMLFEALAGRLPFAVDGTGELMSMHLFTEPPPLLSLKPDVPEKLANLVDRMLVKAADSRPGTTQVVSVLSEIAESLSRRPAGGGGQAVAGSVATNPVRSEEAFRPTVATTGSAGFFIGTPELRRLFEQRMPTDSAFDAFVLDHFPTLKRRFSPSQDRLAKTNLLLELADPRLLAASLRRAFPDAFAAVLVVQDGIDGGRLYPLPNNGQVVIGRGVDADIRLPQDPDHASISRRHAILELGKGLVSIRLEGKNPISVNGQTVTAKTRLDSGARIQIGGTVFLFASGLGSQVGPSGDDGQNDGLVWDVVTHQPQKLPQPQDPPETAAQDARHPERLFWGLSDRVLAMGRVAEAERMMGPRLVELKTDAQRGQIPEGPVIADVIARALKLAAATGNAAWVAWIFEFAGLSAR